ncbi:MAG: hypothetical protein J0M24_22425 [Verrucomicrobia bacterium]|nr:hypothetical protein [Verrucomicrobiota bacterium]
MLEDAIAATFDFDNDGLVEFDYLVGFGGSLDPQEDYHRIGFVLRSHESGRNLAANGSRIPFQSGELVSSTNPPVANEGGGNQVSLGGYDQVRSFPGAEWRYYDVAKNLPGAYWRNRTELLFGIRFALEDGLHYGWIRFTRPDTTFTTPFELAAYDWNPLPGEPIAAGLPPAIPLVPQITPEGLRLTWPGSLGNWILEFTDELRPDAEWLPVPGVGGPDIIVEASETHRYFRLRRP